MRAVVRLRPKGPARDIRHGAPWVYSNDIVADRRTRALAAGAIARLEDSDRNALGTVALNLNSRLAARVLDPDPEAEIGREWLAARLRSALNLREAIYDAPFYRLVHAEGDGLPGLVIDRFADVLVVQPNAAWIELLFDDLCAALDDCIPGITTIVKNCGGRARTAEGLSGETEVTRGTIEAPVPVLMNGATYMADLIGGQKTGLFFDQRDNHAAFARVARGRVLDVFSHVGGFGLAALAAGAEKVTAVDGSGPALVLAGAGAKAMGRASDFDTREGDAFAVMEELTQDGEQFDAVACDPPAFAPSKKSLGQGLRAYERVARLGAGLVRPGGYLTLCSCSHAADLEKFLAASTRGIGRAGRQAQLIHTGFAGADHPQVPYLGEPGYLKALLFRITA